MNASLFISTTWPGLARAERAASGSWTVETLLTGEDVRCLASDPHSPDTLYAGTQGNGVLRSVDRGRTWEPAGLQGHIIKALAVSPAEPGKVYAGTKPPMLFSSTDGGTHWTEIVALRHARRWFWRSPAEMPLTPYVQSIGLSPTDPQTIVIGIEAGAVLRSGDGGKTWSGHCTGALRDCHSLTFHHRSGDHIYEAGGTGAGASMSHTAGKSWEQPSEGLDRHYGWACAADPIRPDVWYVSESPMSRFGPPAAHIDGKANAYIFRSMNGGSWEKLTGGLPDPLQYMAYALLTDPQSPGHLYAGLSHGEVWHSADYGDSWEKLPFRLPGIHRSLIMLPG